MEKALQNRLRETMKEENVIGCIVSDKHGLCLASSNVKEELSGFVTAISHKASKIEPERSQPVILLNHSQRSCIIHDHNGAVTAVFKSQKA